ncbi:MAG: hypothetical protein RL318_2001 [Fibrobacterota bacterium]|jgi:uncharacterized protein YbjT (DUF2867 family)
MNILIFGATGMVGHGVLLECFKASDVERVVSVGRSASALAHPKFGELLLPDLFHVRSIEEQLSGFDACFFCLGVSAAGLSEAVYSRLTFDLTITVAEVLARRNPGMVLVYVSGEGTDSSEKGRVMWARVKGRTENALLGIPFRSVHLFRPGIIQPLDGIRSKTRLYQAFYSLARPFLPWLVRHFPDRILTTRIMGRAMLECARQGMGKAHLEIKDIAALGKKRSEG